MYPTNPLSDLSSPGLGLLPADFLFGGSAPSSSVSPTGQLPAQALASLAPLSQASTYVPNIGTAGVTNPSSGTGLGLNMPTAQLALTGLSTLGNLWAAFQAQKLARAQFRYTKDVTETNLANQIKSYNTTLADRARSRGFVEGQSPAQVQGYIDQNQLTRRVNGG